MPDTFAARTRARLGPIGPVLVSLVAVGLLTALVYFIRADQAGTGNWPVTYELGSSDNGVLFQFARDVFTGQPLAWTFSPQVFVFPEIPISLVAYLLAFGSVQAYFVIVAAVNNAILFFALFGIVRRLFPSISRRAQLGRAGIAAAPLLLLPLVTANTLFEYALAPTYYFGMYVVILGAPLLYLTRRRWAIVAIVAALALTVASDPLAIVFTLPALLVVTLARIVLSGWRSILNPAALTGATLIVALVIRLVLLTGLEGTSPLTYIDPTAVPARRATLVLAVTQFLSSGIDTTVVIAGLVCAIVGFGSGVVVVMRAIRARKTTVIDERRYTLLYFRLVPITGLAASAFLLILNSLYLWPILVAPLVFVLLELPARWIRPAAATAGVAFVGSALLLGTLTAATSPLAYLSYRGADTRCLDARLPSGMTTGYAAYFDARRVELPSATGIRLIQVGDDGRAPYDWLTNRDYPARSVGSFFLVNAHTGHFTLGAADIEGLVGAPDRTITCSDLTQVLIYTSPAKLARVKSLYHRDF